MSSVPRELSTVADIDDEIARLTKAREEQIRLQTKPEEQKKRRIRREQLVGRWGVTLALQEEHLQEIRNLAGTEAWLFEPDHLQSDGWKNDNGLWSLPRQSPGEGAGS